MAEPEYKRLTRSRARSAFALAVTSRSSLWLGADHLLVVDTSGYSETYKRFYFRDIQAFSIALTDRRNAWNWILGVLMGLCIPSWSYAIFSATGPKLGLVLFASITTLVFAVPLLVNNLLGPTCTCHLRTAVQTEQLSPLSRLRRARRVLATLRPLIASAQGLLTAEEIPSRVQRLGGAPVEATPESTDVSPKLE